MSSNDPFYDRFKPAQTDSFSDWQYNIQNNFDTLSQTFQKNHVGFYSAIQPSIVDQGKHTLVQLFAGMTPQTELLENNIYSKLDIQNMAQMFMAMQNNQSNFQFSSFQEIIQDKQGLYTTSLPGNFVLNFGIYPYSGSGTTLPTHIEYAESIVFIFTSPVFPLGGSVPNNNSFAVNLVPQEKGNYISVVWGSTTVAPTLFFYMYIEKFPEVKE